MLLKQALRFFLPWACAGCRTPLLDLEDPGFCGRCWLRIPRINGLVCRFCGLPLPDGGESCYGCRQAPLSLLVRAATEYKGPVPPAVHRFKYFGRKTLAGPFGRLLQSTLALYGELRPIDGLVPIPLHKGNLRMRGFNQAESLAENLARLEGLPLMAGLLNRQRPTTPQYRLGKLERRNNVRRAFVVTDRKAAKGRHLLLMDDVCTTGATLEACAWVLRQAGAASVKALVLARD